MIPPALISSCSVAASRLSHRHRGTFEDPHKGTRELRQVRPAGARDDVAVHHVRSLLEGGTGSFEIRLQRWKTGNRASAQKAKCRRHLHAEAYEADR